MKTTVSQPYLSLKFLIATGLYPLRLHLPRGKHSWWNSNALYSLYTVYVMWQVMSLAGQLAGGLFVFDLNFTEVAVVMCNLWVMLFTSAKMILFCVRRKKLYQLILWSRDLHKKVQQSSLVPAHTIFRKSAAFASRLAFAYFWVTFITSLGLYVGPKTEVGLFVSRSSNSSRPKLFEERYGIPLAHYFPFDIKQHLAFCNIYEFISCAWAGLAIVAPDVFVCSVIQSICAQFEVVAFMFSNPEITASCFTNKRPDIEQSKDFTYHNTKFSQQSEILKRGLVQRGLKISIRHHSDVFRFGREVENFCHPFMALQVAMSGGVICLTIFQLSKISPYSPSFMVVVEYFIMGCVLTFSICYFSQDAHSKSLSVALALYNSKWMDESQSFQKDVKFCIQRSQKALRFTALKTGSISLHLFINVLKQSYSLFALIQRVESD